VPGACLQTGGVHIDIIPRPPSAVPFEEVIYQQLLPYLNYFRKDMMNRRSPVISMPFYDIISSGKWLAAPSRERVSLTRWWEQRCRWVFILDHN